MNGEDKATGPRDALLEVRSLSCVRDDRTLFRNLSFAVHAGEIVQLTGPNGSGKTTMLRGIAGLSTRCRGGILWRGEERRTVIEDFRGSVLFLGHEPGVKMPISPLENLAWSCAMLSAGGPGRDQIVQALARVGLQSFQDTPCQYLSAGQRRRVALARLLLSPALLWILDEPFTAIDLDGVAAVETLLAAHASKGGAVLLTTHHRLSVDYPVTTVTLGMGD